MAFILLSLCLVIVIGCSKISDAPAANGPKRELPLAEYRDTTTLSMYEGSRLSWILKTKYLVKWPRTDLVRARPVDLIVYDTLGNILVRVTADSGTVDEGISFLVASGHVHGHSEKGVDIKSDSLRWNKAINQISTEARVRVVSEEGDVLTGKGFISDAKLDNWQILSDVKGVFQKIEERIEKAEADTTRPAAQADTAKPAVVPPKPGDALNQPGARPDAAPAVSAPTLGIDTAKPGSSPAPAGTAK